MARTNKAARFSHPNRVVILAAIGTALGLLVAACQSPIPPPTEAGASESQGSCVADPAAELDMIPNGGKAIIVRAELNQQPANFALDTGTFWSTVQKGYAAGYKSRWSSNGMLGSGGSAIYEVVRMPDFKLGSLQYSDIDFYVVPDPASRTSSIGNLGNNVLKAYDLEIDPAHGKVRLYHRQHCSGRSVYWAQTDAVAIPFTFPNSQISVPVVLDGKPMRALIDTGATYSILTTGAAWNQFQLSYSSPDVVPFTSASTLDGHPIQLFRHRFSTLQIGKLELKDPWVMLGADRVHTGHQMADPDVPKLALGLYQLLQLHLYFDFGHGVMYASTVRGDAEAQARMVGGPVMSPTSDANK